MLPEGKILAEVLSGPLIEWSFTAKPHILFNESLSAPFIYMCIYHEVSERTHASHSPFVYIPCNAIDNLEMVITHVTCTRLAWHRTIPNNFYNRLFFDLKWSFSRSLTVAVAAGFLSSRIIWHSSRMLQVKLSACIACIDHYTNVSKCQEILMTAFWISMPNSPFMTIYTKSLTWNRQGYGISLSVNRASRTAPACDDDQWADRSLHYLVFSLLQLSTSFSCICDFCFPFRLQNTINIWVSMTKRAQET